MNLWFFSTPVLYSYADLNGTIRTLLRLNPMTHVLNAPSPGATSSLEIGNHIAALASEAFSLA